MVRFSPDFERSYNNDSGILYAKTPQSHDITRAGIKMDSYTPTFSLIHDSKKV